MRESDQHAFERPDTFFNTMVDRFVVSEPKNRVDAEKVSEWLEVAKKQFAVFFDMRTIEEAVNEANWEVVDGPPPKNVWAGEALFNGRPTIRIYTKTHLARVPFSALFDALGVSLIHHILGHIVPRHAGKNDYGEDVACQYQMQAAELSDNAVLKNLVSPMIPIFSWLHKNIRYLLSFFWL